MRQHLNIVDLNYVLDLANEPSKQRAAGSSLAERAIISYLAVQPPSKIKEEPVIIDDASDAK